MLFHTHTTPPPARHWTVGYSGGMDSHVLLHAVVSALREGRFGTRTVEAVYIDHGLQAASVAWRDHCAQTCAALGVHFRTLAVDAQPLAGESPEAAARRARYTALSGLLDENSALLTAHHRDDQAETVLLQLLRGAGPQGLSAMPTLSRLGKGWLWRPLLTCDRADIVAYAHTQHLQWVEDPSNQDTHFDRNFLRHVIFPQLRTRWPAASVTMARAAQFCAEAAAINADQADSDLEWVRLTLPQCRTPPFVKGGLGGIFFEDAAKREQAGIFFSLSLQALRTLSPARQRNLLRRWLARQSLPVPDSQRLQQLLETMLTAAPDRQPQVQWPGAQVRRYRNGLYAMRLLVPWDRGLCLPWCRTPEGDGDYPPLHLPDGRVLSLDRRAGAGLSAAVLDRATLTIRSRQGGERFRPQGRTHSTELKKLLQEVGIPPWERERLPLLYGDDELLAVIGVGIAAEAVAGGEEMGLMFRYANGTEFSLSLE